MNNNNQECENLRGNYTQLSVPSEWLPEPGSNTPTECNSFEFTYDDLEGMPKTGELFLEINLEKKIVFVGVN